MTQSKDGYFSVCFPLNIHNLENNKNVDNKLFHLY